MLPSADDTDRLSSSLFSSPGAHRHAAVLYHGLVKMDQSHTGEDRCTPVNEVLLFVIMQKQWELAAVHEGMEGTWITGGDVDQDTQMQTTRLLHAECC